MDTIMNTNSAKEIKQLNEENIRLRKEYDAMKAIAITVDKKYRKVLAFKKKYENFIKLIKGGRGNENAILQAVLDIMNEDDFDAQLAEDFEKEYISEHLDNPVDQNFYAMQPYFLPAFDGAIGTIGGV
jgi:hypothetical protein